jgi:drug/metabolite transporter (DMT)-like permease
MAANPAGPWAAMATRRPSQVWRLGLAPMILAVVCLSAGSSIVRKAGAPGVTIALWRMVLATVIWHAVLLVRGQRLTAVQWRRAAVPGLLFGCNIAVFFTALTHTTVAHVEFIGSLAPVIVVPVGAMAFGEQIPARSLPWAALAIAGVSIVLFLNPTSDATSAGGAVLAVVAMVAWSGYLLTAKRWRGDMDVARFMAAAGPFAVAAMIPMALARGGALNIDGDALVAIVLLSLLTGTTAHGLIILAQRDLPVSTAAIIQVAQPALAVGWAYLILNERLRAVQVAGATMVVLGLAVFLWTAHGRANSDEDIARSGIHD